MFEEENWREIEGSDGVYYVSDLGRIKKVKKNKFKIISQHPNPKGYLYYRICSDKKQKAKSVSRAVAKAFPETCGEWFEGCDVDHINTLKSDNRAVNLRVVNHITNCRNPLTVALRRKNMSDEEWEKYQKEKERYFKKKDYEEHKEYYKNYAKQYYEKHKEKFKDVSRQYYQEHKEELKEYYKNRYKKKKAG